MTDLQLTEAQKQFLHDQVIDESQPSPVLHDFQVVLDYVGTDGVKAAGKYNLLPIEAVGELDPKLRRPLRLSAKMKRPMLRSHPYLLGLHLLLRASGLARVEGAGDKTRLVLDRQALGQWEQLNPTERYFNLLESWLLRGRTEMVGERARLVGGSLADLLPTWRYLPAQGKTYDLSRPQDVYVHSLGRDFYQVALADLFGLLEVEHPAEPVSPWCPTGLKHRPFGDAALTLIGDWYFSSAGWRLGGQEEGEADFGLLQPLFQAYFPEWQENLVLEQDEEREGVYVFKVSLGRVWRRIAVPSGASLDVLAGAILDSVKFDSDHLYRFIYRDRFGATVNAMHPYCDEGPFTDEVAVGQLPLEPGQSMTFHFDFGDDWRFDVKLERINPPDPRLKRPKVLESKGKAPEQYPAWE
jgi:hypothetical protein